MLIGKVGNMKKSICILALAAFAAPASAATISVSSFDKSAYEAVVDTFGSVVTEDFESFSEGNVADGFSTSVGSFSTLGGTGSGGTVTGAGFANDGSLLAVRDGNVYGRVSTTAALTGDRADDKFLDSNDTYGIRWDISLGGSMFDRVVFSLTDATDVGARMVLDLGGTMTVLSGLANGAQKLVEIDLGGAFSSATLFFTNYKSDLQTLRLNDGFSIDDISVSEVPLPASSLLLMAGLGGFAAMRRRKQTA
jgi:hypothetical protein